MPSSERKVSRVVDAMDAAPFPSEPLEPIPNFTIDLPIFHLLLASPANLVGGHLQRALK